MRLGEEYIPYTAGSGIGIFSCFLKIVDIFVSKGSMPAPRGDWNVCVQGKGLSSLPRVL